MKISFNVGDNVRYFVYRTSFEKGSNTKFSKTIHKIIAKNEHSYTLYNNKTYQYNILQNVDNIETSKIINTQQKEKEPKIEQIKRNNITKGRLNKEGVGLNNIISDIRERKLTDRYKS